MWTWTACIPTATDVPLPGVDVTITDSHGTPTVVTTDGDGYFSQLVPPGSTTVMLTTPILSFPRAWP